MTIDEFEKNLKDVNLSKKEFAEIIGAAYNGVIKWGNRGETPAWVDSWFFNYKKAKEFDELKKTLNKLTQN